MSNTYICSTNEEIVRLIQITDPHLFNDENGELLGINTQASFNQVLEEIKQSEFNYELVLATGDLVQDSSNEGYLRFCQSISKLGKSVFWIPGNHDYQPKMFEILNDNNGQISPAKHILFGKYWQIIMLDSQVYGVPHGKLESAQLAFLDQKLKNYPQRHSLIVLHHHILSTNCAWLDQHNLRNALEFANVLSGFNNVKGILYGHIHQSMDALWQGYKVMATPSTCIQFKPDNNSFSLDCAQPGWRELELYPDGDIQTRVRRIKQKTFLPNMLSEGY
ncbi:3',5'-cyclic-AMP phosphodiesterase [Avibacterium sp. 21-586]|uniref:3',5'-cyclic-AMP phosphodiesterase n=1 Tax=Avibacterium sp. 21-586 TaxID=2911534 RepID=UPI002247DA25|nr:3',5'-cyclic-AMP phosphodiesterase [Avibacterium sp. 21-586]MCW9709936.1 3',5'-cyclic-AMP phosphodiesterase [Avibacterium sp. 21-586]